MIITDNFAVIAGGGSGLGAATARALARKGATPVIIDINADGAHCVADETGGSAHIGDIADADAMSRIFDEIQTRLGTPRILVNCAGIASATTILEGNAPLPLDRFETIVRVNLVGTFNLMRLFASAVAKAHSPIKGNETRGVLVNTSSVAAFDGPDDQIAYCAAKGGVASMTLPAARELARFGIRVMTIAPGTFATAMLGVLGEQVRLSLGAAVPFPPRLGEPEEYANLAVHLIENEMMNGEVLRIDGGLRVQGRRFGQR